MNGYTMEVFAEARRHMLLDEAELRRSLRTNETDYGRVWSVLSQLALADRFRSAIQRFAAPCPDQSTPALQSGGE